MSGNPQLANTFRSSLDRARNMRESFKKQEGSLHHLSNDFGTIETETLLRQNFSQVYSKYMKTRPQEIITVQDNSSPHISHKPPVYPQINSSSKTNHNQQSSSTPQIQTKTPQIQSHANNPKLQSSQPQSPASPSGGGGPPSAFNLHAQLPHSSTNPSPAVIHHPAEVQLPTQALIDVLSPTDLKMWRLQRRNEELADRLYETHVILDIIMKKYRDLSHSVAIQTVPQNTVQQRMELSNLENPQLETSLSETAQLEITQIETTKNTQNTHSKPDQHVPSKSRSRNSKQPPTTPNHHISIPISDINKFRQIEFEHRRKLEHKLDETMGIMQKAANYEENQHYKNIEKIRSLEVQNKGLREMMAGSERARDLALEALQLEAEEESEHGGDLESSKNVAENHGIHGNHELNDYCGGELETSASGEEEAKEEEVLPLETSMERSENVDDSREIDLDDSSNYEEKEFSFNFESTINFEVEDDSLRRVEEKTVSPSKHSTSAETTSSSKSKESTSSSNCSDCSGTVRKSKNLKAENGKNCESQGNGIPNGESKLEVNGDEMDFDSYTMDEQVEQILKENSAAFEKEYTNGDHADYDYQYQNGDRNYSNSDSDPNSDSDEEEARIERNIREQFTSLTTNHSRLLKDGGSSTTQSFQMNGYLNGDHDEEEQKEEDTYESVNSQRMQRSSEQKNFADIFVANACQSMTASRKSDALPKNGDVMFGNKLSWKSTTNNHELPSEQKFNDHDENEENEIDSDEAQVIPQNHKQNQGDSDITNSSPVVHQ